MRQALLTVAILLTLGGCTWLYQSPYQDALATARPVLPPPGLGLR